MVWVTWGNSTLVRTLVVALAIFGTGADALPLPFLAAAGLCAPDGEGPFAPDRDDERDELPDDASDLAWPQVRIAARSGRSDLFSRLSHLLWTTTPDWEAGARRCGLPTFRAARLDEVTVPLPITLCRLTC
jgi:hypothetical protein